LNGVLSQYGKFVPFLGLKRKIGSLKKTDNMDFDNPV